MEKIKFKQTEIGMIPEDWDLQTCSEFCESVRDGTHESPKKINSGKYLITSRHLKSHNLDFNNAYLISQEDFNKANKRSKVDQWDVLISMIGTIGEVYLERKNPDYAIKNVGLFKSEDELKGKWLYYWLKSPKAKYLIRSYKSGTTQEYITLDELRKFPISFPLNKEKMKNIVEVLDTITLEIEILQRQNKILEEIGKAIFKHWFVDFEFPDEKGKALQVFRWQDG